MWLAGWFWYKKLDNYSYKQLQLLTVVEVIRLAVVGVPSPRTIAEWNIDQTRTVRISGWENVLQDMTLTSTETGQPIAVKVLRAYLSELDGIKGNWEWNMVSKQGMAALNGFLALPDVKGKLLSVTRQGAPPKTKWLLSAVAEGVK